MRLPRFFRSRVRRVWTKERHIALRSKMPSLERSSIDYISKLWGDSKGHPWPDEVVL